MPALAGPPGIGVTLDATWGLAGIGADWPVFAAAANGLLLAPFAAPSLRLLVLEGFQPPSVWARAFSAESAVSAATKQARALTNEKSKRDGDIMRQPPCRARAGREIWAAEYK